MLTEKIETFKESIVRLDEESRDNAFFIKLSRTRENKDKKKLWKHYFLSGKSLLVNRKYCYKTYEDTVLSQLIKEKFVVQIRTYGAGRCNRSYLILNKNL